MDLVYPFDERQPDIRTGAAQDVGHGINWLRMPIDLSLQPVNVWCVAHKDALVVFDTGLRSPATAIAWSTLKRYLGAQTR